MIALPKEHADRLIKKIRAGIGTTATLTSSLMAYRMASPAGAPIRFTLWAAALLFIEYTLHVVIQIEGIQRPACSGIVEVKTP